MTIKIKTNRLINRKMNHDPNKPASMVKLVWPIFIELILTMLVGNVDQYMVTRYSENAVGAIGNANQIINLLLIMFAIVSMSTTILVAQYIGSNNKHKISIIYTLSVFVNLIFSAVIVLIILLFSNQIFDFMNIPGEIRKDSLVYIKTVGGFIFLQGIIATFSAIFRSNRMMKDTMKITVALNIVNVLGNALFIHGFGPIPAMGVFGAAMATNLSRLVGVILFLYMFAKKFETRISFRSLKPFPKVELHKLLGIGLPSGGESLSYSMAMTSILKIANTLSRAVGPYVVNTMVLTKTLAWFSFLYANAVGQASQVVIGNYMGAGEVDKVDRRVMRTLRNSVLVAIVISTTMFIFSDTLYGLFSTDPKVLELGKSILLVEIFLQIGKNSNITLVRSLQATGDIKFPMMVGIVSMWAVAVGFGFFLGVVCNLGLVGVWIGMALDEDIRAVIFLIRWKKGKWKNIRLAND
ncbi:MATE family efflux transporter [Mobilitalea sibirica]|uniref:MATE family efflux transporter n=1 Tax=Mobilitalea sibirica TaxID=1462919 RepID=A0A8J7KX90_9FIRM|nr:MATE family efflux transporter [Mobilitalea sibirica]MBH1941502.1 MATE family efflux transporter [Mobilitalea sibirica]